MLSALLSNSFHFTSVETFLLVMMRSAFNIISSLLYALLLSPFKNVFDPHASKNELFGSLFTYCVFVAKTSKSKAPCPIILFSIKSCICAVSSDFKTGDTRTPGAISKIAIGLTCGTTVLDAVGRFLMLACSSSPGPLDT
jgi:hypothetical protein